MNGAPAVHKMPMSERDRLLHYASKSIVNYGIAFLEKDFRPETTSQFMYEMATDMGLRGHGVKPLVNMIPRGHVKTTLTRAMILQDFTMQNLLNLPYQAPDDLFYIWVAESEGQSELNLLSVKDALENNSLIRYYFGDQVNRRKWSNDTIQLKNGCVLMIKSNTSGIRGLNYLGRRPDIIIADDIESENNTKTPEARDRNARLVTATLIPATNAETGLVIINNTPVHHDCFVMRVTDGYNKAQRDGRDFPWRLFYRSTSIENPLWPEYMGKDMLTRKKAQLEQAGQLGSWYMEYEMSVDDKSAKKLSIDDLREWDGSLFIDANGKPALWIRSIDSEPRDEKVPIRLFAGVDMASSMDTGRNDFTAIVITAIDHLEREFVVWTKAERGMPLQTLPSRPDRLGVADLMHQIEESIEVDTWVIEDTAVSHGLFDALEIVREERKKRGKKDTNPYTIAYKPTGDKLERIYSTFSPKAARRRLYVRSTEAELRNQWFQFGTKMTNDDLIDAQHLSSRAAIAPPAPIYEVQEAKIVQESYIKQRRGAFEKLRSWRTQ
jgi:hypothetical protein